MEYLSDRLKNIVIVILIMLVVMLALAFVIYDSSCEVRSRVCYDALNVCYGLGKALPIYTIG